MAVKPFIRGKNAVLKLDIDGESSIIRVKSFAIDEIGTEGADNTCGEDRARPFFVCDYYELGFQAFLSDLKLFNQWLSMLAAEDANTTPLALTAGLEYDIRDGTKSKYMLTECTRRAAKVDAGGRGDAIMFPSGIRARYCTPTQ